MASARTRLEWAQTSSVIAMIVNMNRDPKKPPVTPDDFNPLAKQRPELVMKGSIEDLKIFLPGGAYGRTRRRKSHLAGA